MPETPVSRARAATERNPGSARESSRPSALPQVKIRYYRRMRPNRVYPFVVSWKGGRGSGDPVTVRLVIGGAQVVPAEQSLDPTRSDDRATFYVTPLAKGMLRGERLEVVQDGEKVQEIRLPCKVTTQRLTWVLLLLTIIVGWWIAPAIAEPIEETAPQTEEEKLTEQVTMKLPPAKAMETRVSRHLPHVLPGVSEYLTEYVSKDVSKTVTDELESVPGRIGDVYAWLHLNQLKRVKPPGKRESHLEGFPIAETMVVVMILLTLFSWLTHLERRKARVGRPIAAARGDED
jgi:hypothetical protein